MNIPEILVADVTGIMLVVFLFLLRVRNSETKQVGAFLYDGMLAVTLAALIVEIISFVLDGRQFRGCHALVVLTNTFCVGTTVLVGFLWCLFVDFRLYRSTRRLRQKALMLGIPCLFIQLLMLLNLFGNGLIFRVSEQNIYSRGPLSPLIYATLFLYFAESIHLVTQSKQIGVSITFFPVFYFVVPCIIGTIIQGMFYGLSVGWMSVAVALVFIHIQLQNFNTFVDETSGLFNRKYMNFYLKKVHKAGAETLYGIMMDVNDFKKINDRYGHAMGDRAIKEIGKILSASTPEDGVAIRMAGDEFVVLLNHSSNKKLAETKAAIEANLQHFNQTTTAPFKLSISMGLAPCSSRTPESFLNELDRQMYAEKKAYHLDHAR